MNCAASVISFFFLSSEIGPIFRSFDYSLHSNGTVVGAGASNKTIRREVHSCPLNPINVEYDPVKRNVLGWPSPRFTLRWTRQVGRRPALFTGEATKRTCIGTKQRALALIARPLRKNERAVCYGSRPADCSPLPSSSFLVYNFYLRVQYTQPHTFRGCAFKAFFRYASDRLSRKVLEPGERHRGPHFLLVGSLRAVKKHFLNKTPHKFETISRAPTDQDKKF